MSHQPLAISHDEDHRHCPVHMDTVDRVDLTDIRQAAIVMATFVYHAANLDRKLPRPK